MHLLEQIEQHFLQIQRMIALNARNLIILWEYKLTGDFFLFQIDCWKISYVKFRFMFMAFSEGKKFSFFFFHFADLDHSLKWNMR